MFSLLPVKRPGKVDKLYISYTAAEELIKLIDRHRLEQQWAERKARAHDQRVDLADFPDFPIGTGGPVFMVGCIF